MIEFKDLDFSNLSDQGFPYCPYCGSPLHWESDYMLTECGYLPETTPLEGDSAVNVVSCPDCGKIFEIENGGNGVHLLSVNAPFDETKDEEPEVVYSEYCKTKYLS